LEDDLDDLLLRRPSFNAEAMCAFSCGVAWPSVTHDAIVTYSRVKRSRPGRAMIPAIAHSIVIVEKSGQTSFMALTICSPASPPCRRFKRASPF